MLTFNILAICRLYGKPFTIHKLLTKDDNPKISSKKYAGRTHTKHPLISFHKAIQYIFSDNSLYPEDFSNTPPTRLFFPWGRGGEHHLVNIKCVFCFNYAEMMKLVVAKRIPRISWILLWDGFVGSGRLKREDKMENY